MIRGYEMISRLQFDVTIYFYYSTLIFTIIIRRYDSLLLFDVNFHDYNSTLRFIFVIRR